MKVTPLWQPPGKNCGLCGSNSCKDFMDSLLQNNRQYADCPFFSEINPGAENEIVLPGENGEYPQEAVFSGKDLSGKVYDFILAPLLGEISARKIVLPFRSDAVERLQIKEGDLVVGRPMSAGCPIPHVLKVQKAELETGLLYTWVVGPKYSREKEVKDVVAYHMIGFEGIASRIAKEPVLGSRASFLPGFCMMNLNHTGLVNMILVKSDGLHIRIEDIHI